MPPRRRPLRRVARIAAGVGLLVAGAALLVLPGPGLPVLLGALLLLETEFHWARRLRARLSELAGRTFRQGATSLLGRRAGGRGEAAPRDPRVPGSETAHG